MPRYLIGVIQESQINLISFVEANSPDSAVTLIKKKSKLLKGELLVAMHTERGYWYLDGKKGRVKDLKIKGVELLATDGFLKRAIRILSKWRGVELKPEMEKLINEYKKRNNINDNFHPSQEGEAE